TALAPDRLVVAAYASALGEGIGFYAGYLVTRYLREDIAGPRRRRWAVILAAAVVEFGPAEILDTVLVRPAAMFIGAWTTGNVVAGVLIGKVVADLVFYGLAITSYEMLVRRFLRRFRRPQPSDDADGPSAPGQSTSGRALAESADELMTETVALLTAAAPVEPVEPPSGPELIMDLDVVGEHYRRFAAALPGVTVHFATKCNPDRALLQHLHRLGCGFEVASTPELDLLTDIGVRPADLIFSNPVKPWWHIREAYAAGVRRFAADSDDELTKLAEHAPGTRVLIRVAVAPAASDVPSEGKFGVDADEAVRLVLAAADAGLRPWGLAFHVGSQMTDPNAWIDPIVSSAVIMERLLAAGVRLSALDIGGGFPADYGQPVPPIEAYGDTIARALATLPYEVEVLAEPGRGIVADAGRLHTTVIGTATRLDRRWLHLDVGAFNGAMEALETARQLVLPMSDCRGGPLGTWTVTGPSCDSQDTLRDDAMLSRDLQAGDRVVLHTAGAYTTAYASTFNGFPVPTIRYVSSTTPADRAAGELVGSAQ
ncbi:MAG TPA: type III PLP-dependent enzyme, partial [Microlunatus sp.]|nr:type III PLP-dependent enzyme [Microlunatus sp.]